MQIERLKKRNYTEDDIENRILEHEKAEKEFVNSYFNLDTVHTIDNNEDTPIKFYHKIHDVLKLL